MARKALCRLLSSSVSRKAIEAVKILLVMQLIAQPIINGTQRCEAVAVRRQQALLNRAAMTSAVAPVPSSPVRRSLLKALSASYGVTFTWPFTIATTVSSSGSNSQEDEPSLSWSITTTSGSSSSCNTVSADQRGQQTSSTSSSSPTPSPLPLPSPSSLSNTGSTGTSSNSGSSSTSAATSSSSRPGPCWRSDGSGGGTEYLTISSKCPNDDFNLAIIGYNTSWTFDNNPTVYGVYFSSGWAVTQGLTENQQITPRQTDGDSGQYVAILRVKDRKWIAPKAVSFRTTNSRVEDGSSGGSSNDGRIESWFDISSRKRRVCVLVGESSDRPFPRFRIVVKTDGDRVLADSVAAVGESISKGSAGVYCEDLKHEAVVGYNYNDNDYAQGHLADAYDPSGCKIVVDDCSS